MEVIGVILKKNSKWHIAYHVYCLTSVSACGTQWVHEAPISMLFYADEGLPLKSYGWSFIVWLFLPVTQAVSIPFCTTLDLQLSSYHPLYYNSRAHYPLLQYLRTSAILAGAHSYLVVSSFKCEGKIVAMTKSPIFVELWIFLWMQLAALRWHGLWQRPRPSTPRLKAQLIPIYRRSCAFNFLLAMLFAISWPWRLPQN